ncbi:MAG: type VI secretion system lipoprotein TssJ [Ignavibacteriaceae bacterium]|jgi:type VI secretion system VasD/TssJ family lipoprotein|nr:type VI secretion system lipoprotein TssJ [Ignavibacteriaceae bacterium]MCW9064662.1 type VI secretion system lipoprotein TssJ [Ignavibacteriaceae bacterium]
MTEKINPYSQLRRENMLKSFIIFMIFISLILLAGCGGAKTMSVEVISDNDANNGNAVVVKIYQLISGDKFRYASFESLLKNPDETLGSDVIPGSKYEKTMVPGENFKLNELELKSGAAYLGIIADFHSPANDDWKQLIDLNSGIDELKILVHENSLSVEGD